MNTENNQNTDIITKQIEAILFYKNEPVSIKDLIKILEINEDILLKSIERLNTIFENRGICLITSNTHLSLATAKDMQYLIETIQKEEMKEDIGKAGLETLAIVLYNEEVSRREVDYIRGVNSSYIIRNLLLRGLIEKAESKESRITRYKPTLEVFALLGIKNAKELPSFELFKNEIGKINEIEQEKTD